MMDSNAVNVCVQFYSGETEGGINHSDSKRRIPHSPLRGSCASDDSIRGQMLLDTCLRYESGPTCKSCLNLFVTNSNENPGVDDKRLFRASINLQTQTPGPDGVVQIHQNLEYPDSSSNVSSTTTFKSATLLHNTVNKSKSEDEILAIIKKILSVLKKDENCTSSNFIEDKSSKEDEMQNILNSRIENFKSITLTLEESLSEISNSLKDIFINQGEFTSNSSILNACPSAMDSPAPMQEYVNNDIQEIDQLLKVTKTTKLSSIYTIKYDLLDKYPSDIEMSDCSIISPEKITQQDGICEKKPIGDAQGFLAEDESHRPDDNEKECLRWTSKDRSIFTDKRFGYVSCYEDNRVTSTGTSNDAKVVMYPKECESSDDDLNAATQNNSTTLLGLGNLSVIIPPAPLINFKEALAQTDNCAGLNNFVKPLLENVEENLSYKTNVFNEKERSGPDTLERCSSEAKTTAVNSQHTLLKKRLETIGKEFTHLQETAALLRDQADTLQYKLVESQQQVQFRDDQISLLQNQLKKLESDYSTNINESNKLKLKLSLNDSELEKLRNDCTKYKQSLKEKNTMAENISNYMQILQEEAQKWKQQFDEAQARMLSMEKETEQLRISLQIDSSTTVSSNSRAEATAENSHEESQSPSTSTLGDQSSAPCAPSPPQPTIPAETTEPVKLPANEDKPAVLWTERNGSQEMSLGDTTEYSDESYEYEDSEMTDEVETIITKKAQLFLKEGHPLRNLDDLKNELSNAKNEASKTKDELRLKIKDLEKDIWKHKDLSALGMHPDLLSVKTSNSCPNIDILKKNPALELSCTLKIKSNEYMAVAKVSTDINERIKYLEKLVGQFKSKQSELALHISSVDVLTTEVDEMRKLGFAREPKIIQLKKELSKERRVSEGRLTIISAQNSDMDACQRELSQLRLHLSKLTNDFTKLSKRVDNSDVNQFDQKIKCLQHELQQKTTQLNYKDGELLNLLKSIETLKKQQCDVYNDFLNEQKRVQRMEVDMKTLNTQKQKEIDRLREEKQSFINNCQELKQVIEKNKFVIDDLQNGLETQQFELNNVKTQHKKISQEIATMRSKMKQSEEELALSNEIRSKLLNDKMSLEDEITELNKSLQTLSSKLVQKESETSMLSNENTKLDHLNKEQEVIIQQFKTDLEKITYEKKGIETAFKNSVKQYSELKDQMNAEMEIKKKSISKSVKDPKTKEMSSLLDKLFTENNELRKMLEFLGTNMMESILPRLCTIGGDFMAQSMVVPIKCFNMNTSMHCKNVQCISTGKCQCKFVALHNSPESPHQVNMKSANEMMQKLEHIKSVLDSSVDDAQYHTTHSWDGIISKSCRSGKHVDFDASFDYSEPKQQTFEGVQPQKSPDGNECPNSIVLPSELSSANESTTTNNEFNWLSLQIVPKQEISTNSSSIGNIVYWKSPVCNADQCKNQPAPVPDLTPTEGPHDSTSDLRCPPPCEKLKQLRGPIFHPSFRENPVIHSTSLNETRIKKTKQDEFSKCPIFVQNALKNSVGSRHASASSVRDSLAHDDVSREFYIKPSFYYRSEIIEDCGSCEASTKASSETTKVSQVDEEESKCLLNIVYDTVDRLSTDKVDIDNDVKMLADNSEKYEEECATSDELSEDMNSEMDESVSIDSKYSECCDSTCCDDSNNNQAGKNMPAQHKMQEISTEGPRQNGVADVLNEMPTNKKLMLQNFIHNCRDEDKDEELDFNEWPPGKLIPTQIVENKQNNGDDEDMESESQTICSVDSTSTINEDDEDVKESPQSSRMFSNNFQENAARTKPGVRMSFRDNAEGRVLLHSIQETPSLGDIDEEEDDDDKSVITVIDAGRCRNMMMYDDESETNIMLRLMTSKRRVTSVAPCLSSVLETDEILSCTTIFRRKCSATETSGSEFSMRVSEEPLPDTTTAITMMSMFASLLIKKKNFLPTPSTVENNSKNG